MNRKPKPLAERITPGIAIVDASENVWATFSKIADLNPLQADTYRKASHEERRANIELIAEAFNVTHETGKTPRQLADERAELITTLKACKGFYGNTTGYYHVSPEAHRDAVELLKRLEP